jgi:hypothetical protein
VTKAARAPSSKPAPGSSASALVGAIVRVERRLRFQRALNAASLAGVMSLSLLGPALLYVRQHAWSESQRLGLLAAAGLFSLAAAAAAALRPVPRLGVARAIDRAHELSDLSASAWTFAQLSAAQRTPFMRATLARAEARAQGVEAAKVWPLRWPGTLLAWPLLALGVLWVYRQPVPPPVPRAAQRALPARLLPRSEVDAELGSLARTPAAADDASLRAVSDEFERLLSLVARQDIDRLQLLRALNELEAQLSAASEHSAEQQAELLELGRALAEAAATQQLGAALANGDLSAGRAALQTLARRVGTERQAHDLARLRAALRDALGKQAQARRLSMQEARRSLDSLLHKRRAEEAAESPAQRLTAKRQLDELLRQERAERQTGSARPPERELDRLERELSQAAAEQPSAEPAAPDQTGAAQTGAAQTAPNQAGANDTARAARELESAADTLRRMQRATQHDRALERLSERVAELRQRLAEQAAAAQPGAATDRGAQAAAGARQLTLDEFQKRARGEQAQVTGPGEPGEPRSGSVSRDGKPGEPPLGAAIQPTPLERRAGSPENAPSAEGSVQHGNASSSGEADVDSALAGVMGRGPSRRTVIYNAAAQGFGTRGYEKVHADYRDHAEAELEREPLPAGYRYYVRRYFQLIQPKEDSHE